jgi:hypothetical protein
VINLPGPLSQHLCGESDNLSAIIRFLWGASNLLSSQAVHASFDNIKFRVRQVDRKEDHEVRGQTVVDPFAVEPKRLYRASNDPVGKPTFNLFDPDGSQLPDPSLGGRLVIFGLGAGESLDGVLGRELLIFFGDDSSRRSQCFPVIVLKIVSLCPGEVRDAEDTADVA